MPVHRIIHRCEEYLMYYSEKHREFIESLAPFYITMNTNGYITVQFNNHAGQYICNILSRVLLNEILRELGWPRVDAGPDPPIYIPEGMVVDHVDGNTLNNLDTNLRPATHSQNMHNRYWAPTQKSPYPWVLKQVRRGVAPVFISNNAHCPRHTFETLHEAIRFVYPFQEKTWGEFWRNKKPLEEYLAEIPDQAAGRIVNNREVGLRCPKCTNMIKNKYDYHVAKCTGLKCIHCGKDDFANQTNLKNHIRDSCPKLTHASHFCPNCNKEYSGPRGVERHLKSRTCFKVAKPRPYKCRFPGCDFDCPHKTALYPHYKKFPAHRPVPQVTTDDGATDDDGGTTDDGEEDRPTAG